MAFCFVSSSGDIFGSSIGERENTGFHFGLELGSLFCFLSVRPLHSDTITKTGLQIRMLGTLVIA